MQPINSGKAERWWPESLGDAPDTTGGQNSVRYAYFAAKDRLAVDTGEGEVSVYDTAGHKVSGVQQEQGGGSKKLVFTSDRGEVELDTLKKV